jgi:hypothetical protein
MYRLINVKYILFWVNIGIALHSDLSSPLLVSSTETYILSVPEHAMSNQTATLAQWPALYNPSSELHRINERNATQPNGRYLYDPHGICHRMSEVISSSEYQIFLSIHSTGPSSFMSPHSCSRPHTRSSICLSLPHEQCTVSSTNMHLRHTTKRTSMLMQTSLDIQSITQCLQLFLP